jgi:cytochrome P450
MSIDPDPVAARERVVDFDPFSEQYTPLTAHEVNRQMRDCPVAYSPHHGGFWTMAKHADVVEAFKRDGKELSARHEVLDDGLVLGGVVMPPMESHLGFMEQDPPLFTPIRQALNPWFSQSAIEARRPRFAALATALLNARIESGSVEMLDDLIRPLAGIVTLELLGFPLEGLAKLAFPLQSTEHDLTHAEGLRAVWDQVKSEIAAELVSRREDGGRHGDLIEALIEIEVFGERLTEQLVIDSLLILLIGGVETVTGAFGGAIHHLDAHPEHRQRLIDEPELLRPAFDEYLRFITPTTQNARTAMCDFELAGQQIRRGDVVYLNLYSANHDERRFSDPHEVILDRPNANRHMALGVGIHHCIGGHLARAVWVTMMEQVLARIPDFEVVHAGVEVFPVTGVSNGFATMPATFTRGLPQPVSDDVERDLARALGSL